MEPLSPRNPRVQAVKRLARQARERADRRAFVVEGPTLVAEALRAGISVQEVFHTHDAPSAVLDLARQRGVDVIVVTDAALESMASTVTPQPVVAVAAAVDCSLDAIAGPGDGHVLVLDAVQDPGNAGTILRTAEASGADAVVFGQGSVDCHNPKVVRASAGSLFRVPVVAGVDLSAALARMDADGRPVMITAAAGGDDYDTVDLARAAIVLGNEARGVSAELTPARGRRVRIPQDGGGESLNVAMAATVLSFEAARQRRAGA